ncbi:hypothetical protein [Treponema sp.]|uniref:hypothetical protein n=1 Tax=Treponema sp. TaxID=166 RepID=UPI0025E85EE8|nr:hypothetical protein [Treponema sp.]MBQ7538517.1 hypothetical protein [Treponema sp.]MBR4323834.1 hypothetical protein [Treponema sp.]
MKKITVPVLNLLLAAGVLLIIAGLLLISRFSVGFGVALPVGSITTMIFGAVIFYVAMTLIHWAVFFFMGLLVFFMGLCMTFVFTSVLPFGPQHLWPIAVLLCGICLLLTCVFKHRKIRGVYLFPTVLIEVLGAFFLLFSTKIIKVPFSVFISKWGPLLLVLAGAALVGIFFWQRNFNDFFPYDKDELSDLTDEEREFYGE